MELMSVVAVIAPVLQPEKCLNMKTDWPKPGDKLKFKGIPAFVYPHFNNIIERVKNHFKVGEIYTVSKCEVYSSWCAVWLEEYPPIDENDEHNFAHLQFFEQL